MGLFTTIGLIITGIMFGMTVTDNASYDTFDMVQWTLYGFGADIVFTILFFVLFFKAAK